MLHIGAVTARTTAEGPGLRFAVWSQGCSIRCLGCFNPQLWTAQGGMRVAPRQLAADAIAESVRDVEGVTVLGGEPFDQAAAFAEFGSEVQQAGLSVMVFTGYELEHLEGGDAPPGAAALLAVTDLLVDGPYVAELRDISRPWVGSTNQRFHFLTDRYRHLADSLARARDRLEVRVSPSGELAINGWATVPQIDALLEDLAPPVGRGKIR